MNFTFMPFQSSLMLEGRFTFITLEFMYTSYMNYKAILLREASSTYVTKKIPDLLMNTAKVLLYIAGIRGLIGTLFTLNFSSHFVLSYEIMILSTT